MGRLSSFVTPPPMSLIPLQLAAIYRFIQRLSRVTRLTQRLQVVRIESLTTSRQWRDVIDLAREHWTGRRGA